MSRNSASISRTAGRRLVARRGSARSRRRRRGNRLELVRPGIAAGLGRRDAASPPAALPALAGKLAERPRRVAVHRHRRVVPGAVAPAGGRPLAPLVARRDARACPSATRSCRCRRKRRARRRSTTIFWWWLAPSGWAPSSLKWICLLRAQRASRRIVVPRPSSLSAPTSHFRMWIESPGGAWRARRGTARACRARRRRSRDRAGSGCRNPSRSAGSASCALQHRLAGELEIVGGVDDQSGPVRALDPPAIAARLEQQRSVGSPARASLHGQP